MKAERFFQPIIANLNHLQLHGLLIDDIHLKFSFSTVVADNLAAHFLGGFQSSFNSGYFCRRCYIKYEDKNLPISVLQIKPRTVLDHDTLVQEIIKEPNRSPLMGIVGLSPLNALIGFHPTISLAPDVMHDFLEGVCPMIIICLLKEASSRRLITYGEKLLFYGLGYYVSLRLCQIDFLLIRLE